MDRAYHSPSYDAFIDTQRKHWDHVAEACPNGRAVGKHYHRYLQKMYRHLLGDGVRVLELGCGTGDLLASLKPARGVGVDVSARMIDIARAKYPDLTFEVGDALTYEQSGQFDVVIMSDLINSVFDVQQLFENALKLLAPGGRIVMNFFSHAWRKPLEWIGAPGLAGSLPEPNWLTLHDVRNLLYLSGAEPVREKADFLMPLKIPLLETLCNRYLAKLWPFNIFCLTHFMVARPHPIPKPVTGDKAPSVSVIIPARNESGNVDGYFKRVPRMGSHTEIVIVEGNSTDDTYAAARKAIDENPDWDARLFKQPGKGKGDAVRVGFKEAKCDVLMILDADLTVAPEDLPKFYRALVEGKGEFINGVRLVYPMESRAMRFLNILGTNFSAMPFRGCWNSRFATPCAERKSCIGGIMKRWRPTVRILANLILLATTI